MHDLCALEGKIAARSIITVLKSNDVDPSHYVTIKDKRPIRYIVPHKIAPAQIRKRVFLKLFPWPAIQVEQSLRNPVMEAWSGNEKTWEASFRRLIARNLYPIPV